MAEIEDRYSLDRYILDGDDSPPLTREQNTSLTNRRSGILGGRATSAKYRGTGFYEENGRKGGEAKKRNRSDK